MRRALVPLLALLLSSSVTPLTARAAGDVDDDVSVALNVAAGNQDLAERLEAELASLGIKVLVLQDGEAAGPLDEVARRAGVSAVVRSIDSTVFRTVELELLIVDRSTGKPLLHQVVGADGPAPLAADIALQTVELLRARLLEMAPPKDPPSTAAPAAAVPPTPLPAPVPMPPPTDARQSPRSSLWLEVGGGLLASPGGVPPAPQLVLELGWRSTRHLGAHVLGTVPLHAARLTAAEGSATVATTMLGAGLDWHLRDADGRWQPTVGAGVSAVWLEMQGVGTSPLVGVSGRALVAAPYARAELALRIGRRLGIVAQGLAGHALGQPVIRFVGRQAAEMGRPFLVGSVAVRLEWP